MDYVKFLDKDEIRSGFLVTSTTKRSWNSQIGLLVEFARICEKYNLKWFAMYGTLLGAVRHGGFIPWDADIDVALFRPDYEKFKKIALNEVRYPYYFDLWYENEEAEDMKPESFPLLPFIKFRDLRTVMTDVDESIAIDIFPLDSFPPFENEELELKFRSIYEIYFAACHTKFIREELAHPTGEFMLGRDRIQRIFDMPLNLRGKLLEEQATQFYFDSKHISTFIHLSARTPVQYERADFEETIYLPFEEISIPAPKGFDKVLTAYYGDWHQIEFKGMYSQNVSVDISYDEYIAKRDLPDNLHMRSNSLRSRFNVDEIRDGKLVTTWRKKIWKVQLDLILELQRVCEKLDLTFWATSTTLFAAVKFHGFNPEDDFITLEMTSEDFSKLKFKFPFRLVENKLMDESTTMLVNPNDKTRAQGIFIEINQSEKIPDEIEYLPFEFTSIPVPKNYEEVLRNSLGDYQNITIQHFFESPTSADISYEEALEKITRIIHYHSATLFEL